MESKKNATWDSPGYCSESSNKIVVVITIVTIGIDKCAIGRRISTRVVNLVTPLLGSFFAI